VGLPVAGGEPDFHCVFVPGENLDVGADDGFVEPNERDRRRRARGVSAGSCSRSTSFSVNQTGQGRVTTCSITRSIPAAGYH
jgi:hypothetical protein